MWVSHEIQRDIGLENQTLLPSFTESLSPPLKCKRIRQAIPCLVSLVFNLGDLQILEPTIFRAGAGWVKGVFNSSARLELKFWQLVIVCFWYVCSFTNTKKLHYYLVYSSSLAYSINAFNICIFTYLFLCTNNPPVPPWRSIQQGKWERALFFLSTTVACLQYLCEAELPSAPALGHSPLRGYHC